jgi:predicted P-loop ATPase
MKKAIHETGSSKYRNPGQILPATEAERFLLLLGKDPAQTWFRTLTPGRGANRSRGGRDLHGFDAAALQADNDAGAAIYFITGDADQATSKNKRGNPTGCVGDPDVHTCCVLYCEWDDRPVDWQLEAWRELGLPQPSLMVPTGGKSIHCYWVLSESIQPEQWRALQARLIDHAKGDTQCKNPSRLMRLPGFRYVDKETGAVTENKAKIIRESGRTYTAAEIEACLPAPVPGKPVTTTLSRQDLPPRGIDEINAAAAYVPRRIGDQGTYFNDRNALCGCSAALAEAGVADPDGAALALLGQLWPTEREARQVLDSTTTRNAASFWAIAREQGYDLKRLTSSPSRALQQQAATQSPCKLPASLQALIQLQPEGWKDDDKASQLSAGRLADMLPAQRFRFDQMDLRAYVETSNGWQRITDDDLDSAYVLLSGMGWRVTHDSVVKAILHVARQTPVHPLREYLQRLENDQAIKPYDLDAVAKTFFRTEKKLHVAMVRKWLIGAAARAMSPGCQMDYVLVLHGDQGLLKSGWFKALASPDWFCSTAPESEKDFLLNVHSCWIFELAELESITRGRETGRLKNLVTTSVDIMRPPYGRTNERLPRSSVFAATCNEETFLRDATGSRRFWVVPIQGKEKLDIPALRAARDGIWKAAITAWRSGELPMLPTELESKNSEQNQQFNEHDPWTDMVLAWMDGDPLHRWDPERDPSTMKYDPAVPFSSTDVLYSAGLKRPDAISKNDQMRVAAVLRVLGFEREKHPVQVEGVRSRRWRLTAQPAQPAQPEMAEVVQPQKPAAAAGSAGTAQPAQPKKGNGEAKSARTP